VIQSTSRNAERNDLAQLRSGAARAAPARPGADILRPSAAPMKDGSCRPVSRVKGASGRERGAMHERTVWDNCRIAFLAAFLAAVLAAFLAAFQAAFLATFLAARRPCAGCVLAAM